MRDCCTAALRHCFQTQRQQCCFGEFHLLQSALQALAPLTKKNLCSKVTVLFCWRKSDKANQSNKGITCEKTLFPNPPHENISHTVSKVIYAFLLSLMLCVRILSTLSQKAKQITAAKGRLSLANNIFTVTKQRIAVSKKRNLCFNRTNHRPKETNRPLAVTNRRKDSFFRPSEMNESGSRLKPLSHFKRDAAIGAALVLHAAQNSSFTVLLRQA